MGKLSIENPFFEFMGRLGDWMILNVLFVLTSLPVVTIGMSTAALYRVTLRMIRKESLYVAREYLQACKEEWRKATGMWLFFLFSGAILFFDLLYAGNMWSGLNLGLGVLMILWSFLLCYAFPVQAQFDNTIANTMKNALYLSVRHLPFTIVMTLLNAIPLFCMLLGSFYVVMIIPIYLLVGFFFTARINGIFLIRIFRPYVEGRGAGKKEMA